MEMADPRPRSSSLRLEVVLTLLVFLSGVRPGAGQEPIPRASWHVAPEWDVGSWDGALNFTRITDLTIGPGERIFVAQPDIAEVWIFDLYGKKTGTLGRRGAGPGEFSSPNSFFWLGDTLAVWDDGWFKLSLFDPNGTFVRSFPAGLMSNAIGVLKGGGIVSISGGAPARSLSAGVIPSLPLRIVRPGTNGYDTIAQLRVDHWRMEVNTGNGTLYGPQPFSDNPLWKAAPDGRGLVLIDRSVEDLSDPPTFSVSLFDSTGSLSTTKRIPFRPLELDRRTLRDAASRQSREVIAWREADHLEVPPGAYTPERFLEAYYTPSVHPPVEDIAFSTDGHIWLRRETRATEAETTWTILDWNLREIGRARLPKELQHVLPVADRLLAVRQDEMDVYHLVCFRMERSR
jgi:hypothetical protein